MCRMVVFTGTCTACGGSFTWSELSQELSCLEAKNNGVFGGCRRGVNMEQHSFNQECESCADYGNDDEGVAGLDYEEEQGQQEGGGQVEEATASASGSGARTKKDDSRKKKKQRKS